MNRCRDCGESYLGGALFCNECGAYLMPEPDSREIIEVPLQAALGGKVSPSALDHRLGFGIKADRIIFVIPSSDRRLTIDLDNAISIGRLDTRMGIWPEVDLTQDKGAEKGVSRRHAVVRTSDEGVVLIDLGSANGTRINDQRLPPKQPHLLNDGDTVCFGKLLIRIYFE